MLKHQKVWGTLVVLYFFLSGIAAGTFIWAGAAFAIVSPGSEIIRQVWAVSFLIACAGGLMLLLELSKKMKFYLVFKNIRSIMTWGAYILGGFVVFSFLSLVFYRLELIIIALIFAAALILYPALEIGIAKGRYFWNSAVYTAVLSLNGIACGGAVYYFVSLPEIFVYERAVISILLISQLVIFAFHVHLSERVGAFTRRENFSQGQGFKMLLWGGIYGLGGILALIFIALTDAVVFLGLVFLLIGSYFLRLFIIKYGLRMDLPGESFNESEIEYCTDRKKLELLEK